jgi:hypothetical protein
MRNDYANLRNPQPGDCRDSELGQAELTTARCLTIRLRSIAIRELRRTSPKRPSAAAAG